MFPPWDSQLSSSTNKKHRLGFTMLSQLTKPRGYSSSPLTAPTHTGSQPPALQNPCRCSDVAMAKPNHWAPDKWGPLLWSGNKSLVVKHYEMDVNTGTDTSSEMRCFCYMWTWMVKRDCYKRQPGECATEGMPQSIGCRLSTCTGHLSLWATALTKMRDRRVEGAHGQWKLW